MSDFDFYIKNSIKVSLEEYSLLKFAVLYAGYKNGEEHFNQLPESLKSHEVGELVKEFLLKKNQKALDKAAAILTNNSSNPWLFLSKQHLTRQGKIALRAGRANARLCLRRYVFSQKKEINYG